MEQLCPHDRGVNRRWLKRFSHKWLRRQRIDDESPCIQRYIFRGWTR